MITESNIKTSLKTLIQQEAASPEYKFDSNKQQIYGRGEMFPGTIEEFKRLNLHHSICVHIYNLSKKYNNFPYTPLVYIAIGSNAHKQNMFNQGYDRFDRRKATTILNWLTKLARLAKNKKYRSNDRIVHALVKFYDKVSQDDDVFLGLLKSFEPKGRKASSWKTMKCFYTEFTKPLFNNIKIK